MRTFHVAFRWHPSSLSSLLFLLLSVPPLAAQTGGIAGTVRDATTGTGLSAVQVEVRGPAGGTVAGAFTSVDGAFRITGVEAGSYTLVFTIPGWEMREEGVAVSPGQTTSLAVELIERSYNLNPITVTTSKTEEKVLEAPGAIEVVNARDVFERPATTSADYVKEKAGVDVITTGLQGNYSVVRGFNNIFSGATLTLTDNRIARVPSLRANISHLSNPTTTLDIDRIEVVLGPGSALYGPNAANGVIHTLTKSPIDYPGVTIAVGNGVRQQDSDQTIVDLNGDGVPETPVDLPSTDEYVGHFEGRIALKSRDERVGFKLSGLYFNSEDFGFVDEVEAAGRAAAGACLQTAFDPLNPNPACLAFAQGLNVSGPGASPEDIDLLLTSVGNVATGRDNDLERWTVDGRLDVRPSPDLNLILSGGRTQAVSSVDLTGLGAGQVIDWGYTYAQARVRYKDFFGQLFFNKSDNDDTFLLRSGRPLVDKSELFVGQLQYASRIGNRERLIYGFDLLRTVPKSAGTINGRHEDDDDITEVGGYIQSETTLSDQWDLVLAARLDDHSRLEDLIFSPRAALVFRPTQEHSLRVTYNRSFSTPTTLNLFLDISGGTVPLGGPFRYDVRAQGTTEDGFTFSDRFGTGVPDHQSPFNLLLGGSPREFLPTTTPQLWAEAVAVVSANDPQAGGLLQAIAPPTDADVSILALTLNLDSQQFAPTPGGLAGISALPPIQESTTQTLELGYKGLIGNRVLLAANAYFTRIEDFVSALRLSTPNVFLNGQELDAYLQSQLVPLVGILFPDELTARATASALAGSISQIPLGVITPTTVGGTTDATLMLTYRNLGDVELFGGDLSAAVLLTDEWRFNVSASFVEDDEFTAGEGTDAEVIPLNAPTAKGAASLSYRNDGVGFNAAVRARFVKGFPVNSGVYIGEIDNYEVFDLNFGYRIPGTGVTAQVDIQNLFDEEYTTFVGTPNLGRYTMFRLRYDFP
ncbi:MAG: TonB-dependent receptor domain-containing protein [Gemmatimonadota bacterium]